jgi:uncharacterized protein
LPKLQRGEGYLWAPSDGVLARVAFPGIRTHDSSRTPKRGERVAAPRSLAEVDLSAITAALAEAAGDTAAEASPSHGGHGRLAAAERRLKDQGQVLATAQARTAELEAEVVALRSRLGQIAALAAEADLPSPPPVARAEHPGQPSRPSDTARTSLSPTPTTAARPDAGRPLATAADGDASLHPAARKLLAALARHAPARFTWGQAATLAGLKPSGGHYKRRTQAAARPRPS